MIMVLLRRPDDRFDPKDYGVDVNQIQDRPGR